jgi:hypothetical protein
MNPLQIITALTNHQWLLSSGLVLTAVVALAKQGWLSDWVAKKLQPTTIPYYTLLLSVVSVGSADLVAGKTWQQALSDAVGAAFTAIATHQFVVESTRRGREIVPPTKTTAQRRASLPPPPLTTPNAVPSPGDGKKASS